MVRGKVRDIDRYRRTVSVVRLPCPADGRRGDHGYRGKVTRGKKKAATRTWRLLA